MSAQFAARLPDRPPFSQLTSDQRPPALAEPSPEPTGGQPLAEIQRCFCPLPWPPASARLFSPVRRPPLRTGTSLRSAPGWACAFVIDRRRRPFARPAVTSVCLSARRPACCLAACCLGWLAGWLATAAGHWQPATGHWLACSRPARTLVVASHPSGPSSAGLLHAACPSAPMSPCHHTLRPARALSTRGPLSLRSTFSHTHSRAASLSASPPPPPLTHTVFMNFRPRLRLHSHPSCLFFFSFRSHTPPPPPLPPPHLRSLTPLLPASGPC